ncbi:unnamed protein product [Brassica oleracea var. botrytis]
MILLMFELYECIITVFVWVSFRGIIFFPPVLVSRDCPSSAGFVSGGFG